MNYFNQICPISKKSNIAKNCFDITIISKDIATTACAGQFAQLKVDGFTLRRPISIANVNKATSEVRFVFEVRGEGTMALSNLKLHDTIELLAPLGHGFTLLDKTKHILLIGGGIGTPPMLSLAEYYGKNATAIIGFRDAKSIILENDFKDYGANVIVCTDDGSYGIPAQVNVPLEDELNKKYDMIYACGPQPMLNAVISLADRYNVECEVSLEARMGCGIGACLVCACKSVKDSKEYYAHVCKDGPVFNAKEVIL